MSAGRQRASARAVEGNGSFHSGLHLLAGLLAHALQQDGLVDQKKHAVPDGGNGDTMLTPTHVCGDAQANDPDRNEDALLE